MGRPRLVQPEEFLRVFEANKERFLDEEGQLRGRGDKVFTEIQKENNWKWCSQTIHWKVRDQLRLTEAPVLSDEAKMERLELELEDCKRRLMEANNKIDLLEAHLCEECKLKSNNLL